MYASNSSSSWDRGVACSRVRADGSSPSTAALYTAHGTEPILPDRQEIGSTGFVRGTNTMSFLPEKQAFPLIVLVPLRGTNTMSFSQGKQGLSAHCFLAS